MKSHADRILAQMPAHRLVAVDALRGLAIAAMVLVNNPGSWSYIYAPLKHADWHGWTPTDVILPLFLYLMASMYFDMLVVQQENKQQQAIIRRVIIELENKK